MFISNVKDLNVQFVRGRQDLLFSPSKSHFVQPNLVCSVLAVPAVPTLWPPAISVHECEYCKYLFFYKCTELCITYWKQSQEGCCYVSWLEFKFVCGNDNMLWYTIVYHLFFVKFHISLCLKEFCRSSLLYKRDYIDNKALTTISFKLMILPTRPELGNINRNMNRCWLTMQVKNVPNFSNLCLP